jgi:PAS domain S-box-containing protein
MSDCECYSINTFIIDRTCKSSCPHVLETIQDFVDSSLDWFWETDNKGAFSFIAGRGAETMGIPVTDIIGHTRREIYSGKVDFDNDNSWKVFLETIENHRSFKDFEFWWKRPDGRYCYISLSGKPIYDNHEYFIGYRGCGRDLTDKKYILSTPR